ncbi:HSPB1-associated protein 1-like, partial [Durusdinium trenchii]
GCFLTLQVHGLVGTAFLLRTHRLSPTWILWKRRSHKGSLAFGPHCILETSWSFPDIGFMQLSAPPVGDAEQRVHEAIARCLASPLLEVRPEGWWLNPDEDLLETSENIEFLMSALQVQLGRE